MKNNFLIIIGVLIFIHSCRMPVDPLGEIKIIKRLKTINTGGSCRDLDVDTTDNVLVAAANYNGFMVYDIQYDGDNISDIVKRVHIGPYKMDPDVGDNRAQEIIIAPVNNLAFILDKEDHIWLYNYNNGIDTLGAYLSKGNVPCYDARSISVAIDESINEIRIYSLIQHYSSGSYWLEDSRSLITTNIELLDIKENIECDYILNQNDIADKIFFSDSLLILGVGELGIQVYRFNKAQENTCVATNNVGELLHMNLDEEFDCLSLYNGVIIETGELIPELIMAFDVPGEIESIYSKDSTIFAGLSNSNGFLQAIINTDGSITGPHQFAVGYTIKGIHHQDNGLLALAAGHDGILLYNWSGPDVSFLGKIETSYANNVKIVGDIILAATEDGIEIIQIDY